MIDARISELYHRALEMDDSRAWEAVVVTPGGVLTAARDDLLGGPTQDEGERRTRTLMLELLLGSPASLSGDYRRYLHEARASWKAR